MLGRKNVARVLAAIEENPQTREQLKENLKLSEEEMNAVIEEIKLQDYAAHSDDKVWKIHSAGMGYLNFYEQIELNKNANNRAKVLNVLTGIMIAALIFVPLFTFFISYSSQSKQLDVFQESVADQKKLGDAQIAALAPVIPKINMSIDPENLIFEDAELSRYWLDDKGNIRGDSRGTRFEFIVRNIGQTDTGSVRINELDEELHLYPGSIYIPNIKGLSAELNYSSIYLENCAGNAPPGYDGKPCTPEAVTNGTRNISFELFCTFCEPKVKIQTFKMCVWRESATECENKTR